MSRRYPREDETATQQERVMRLLNYNLKPFYDFFKLSFHTRASDSYGGQMYEYLNRKDAEWTSELYRWLQASPEQAAKMLRHPASSVTGKYDPTNKAHDPANPATWLIPSWKNVSFNFTMETAKVFPSIPTHRKSLPWPAFTPGLPDGPMWITSKAILMNYGSYPTVTA